MNFEEKWKNMRSVLERELPNIRFSFDEKVLQKEVRWNFHNINHFAAADHVNSKDYIKARKRFSFQSLIAEYCFLQYNINWPYWLMKPYTAALLSDNGALIRRFSNLPVDEHKIYDDPKEQLAFWNYTLQGLLREDENLMAKGIASLEAQIERKHEISINKAHLFCTRGIADNDRNEIFTGLKNFEEKRNKSRFVKNDLCEEILSYFPLAYAKIAWIKGIEVDPGSKYMPIDILEIKPLDEYTIPYWFLRDFYKEQGEDWKYEPLYPEIQKNM